MFCNQGVHWILWELEGSQVGGQKKALLRR